MKRGLELYANREEHHRRTWTFPRLSSFSFSSSWVNLLPTPGFQYLVCAISYLKVPGNPRLTKCSLALASEHYSVLLGFVFLRDAA